MPSTSVAVTAPYFILMNEYNDGVTGTNRWSVQTHFQRDTNTVVQDTFTGGGNGTYTPQPLVLDQWVELRVEIDLDVAPQGNFSVFYNNQPIAANVGWTDPTFPTPPHTIAAVDLYDDNIDVFYYDSASLLPVVTSTCYANCDHSTSNPCLNVGDFGCFLNAFAGGQSYANCDGSTLNPVLTVADFGCFLNRFAAGCSSC